MIAFLRNEEGGDVVGRILKDPQSQPVVAHTINVMEVFDHFRSPDIPQSPEEAIAALLVAGVEIRDDMELELCVLARDIKYKHPMSWPDAIGIAFSIKMMADFVTADRAELEPVEAAKTALVSFIR